MLVLSRERHSGQAKYAYANAERKTEAPASNCMLPTPALLSLQMCKQRLDTNYDNNALQSFAILLSNIEQKTSSFGYVIDFQGMYDSFTRHVLQFKR